MTLTYQIVLGEICAAPNLVDLMGANNLIQFVGDPEKRERLTKKVEQRKAEFISKRSNYAFGQ